MSVNPTPTNSQFGQPEKKPDLFMERLRVQSYDVGGLQWELLAKNGEGFTNKNSIWVHEMEVKIFENNKNTSVITSDEGLMNTGDKPLKEKVNGQVLEGGDMVLEGHVVAISNEGNKLETNWLHHHKNTDLVTTESAVRVTRLDSITEGVGLEAKSDLSNIQIFNQTVTIPDK